MAKCLNCNIEILDDTDSCPLCSSILVPGDEMENMYPNVRIRMRRLMFISRIYLFCAILTEALLFSINLAGDFDTWWCVIPGLGLLYLYMVLRFAILGKSNYMVKAAALALIAVIATIGIDFATGYRGWSVDFGLPAGLLLIDVVIIICMIVNHRRWQSYMLWQILMILCSLLPILLHLLELERMMHLVFLPLAVSVALFLGTLIIGGRPAVQELKRRFHIN